MHNYLLRTVAAALAVAGCTMAADAAGNLVLRGLVTDAQSWATSGPQRGIYYVPMTADEQFRPVAVSNENWVSPFSALEVDGIYLSHDVLVKDDGTKEYFINRYDLNTDQQLGHIPAGDYTPLQLFTADGSSVVGLLRDNYQGSLGLGWVFYSDSQVSYRSSYSVTDEYCGLYYDGRDFYVIKPNVEDGTVTGSTWGRYDTRRKFVSIGDTGVAPITSGSLARHPQTGELYWAVNGALYKLNMSTGQATQIVAWPDKQELVSLEFVEEVNRNAPHPAENLQAVFENGSLSGEITFTAPASNLNGQQGASLTYTVTDTSAGTVMTTGSCTYGQQVQAPVTVTADGPYNFEVTMFADDIAGEPASLSVYIGKDAPARPQLYAPETTDHTVALHWNPVTRSLNGGYVDFDAITYSVVRYPDHVTVAQNITETAITDVVPEPDTFTAFYYGVTAQYNSFTSPQGTSLKVAFGAIVPPYDNTFPNSDSMLGFTSVSGNGATNSWQSDFMGGAAVSGETDKTMDQWLISPPLKLESGYNYLIKVKGYTNGNRKETLSIVHGTAPTPEAMTDVLASAEFSAYSSYYPDETQVFLAPGSTGTHYIAIHCTSPAGFGKLYITQLAIELGIADNAPGSCTDISVQRDLSGKPLATVAFKAPTLTYSGQPLTEISSIKVRRGDTIVKEFGTTEPGSELTFSDELPAAGEYIYRIQAFNADGGGFITNSDKSFVGAGKPSFTKAISAIETAENIVELTWQAIDTDVDGNAIDPAYVTYEVRDDNQPLAINHPGTSLTHDYTAEGATQRFRQFSVRGITAGGTGSYNYAIIPVGPALDSFSESFPGGNFSTSPLPTFVQTHITAGASWKCGNASIGLFPAQDSDDGFIVMTGTTDGTSSGLMSLKISLAEMTNPGVSLWVRGWDNGTDKNLNEIYIDAREVGTDAWTELGGNILGDFTVNGKWSPFGASLATFAGKTIQIRVRGVIHNYGYLGIDNIRVASMLAADLEAAAIAAQSAVAPGEQFPLTFTVRNNAALASAPARAVLYAGDKELASAPVPAIDALQQAVITFTATLDETPLEYHAEIICTDDERPDNNVSDTITVYPILNLLPRVTDLSASATDDNVVLTWSTPDLTGAVVNDRVTESFEDAASFASAADGWTFVDVDQKPVGSITSLQLPNYSAGAKMGFFVMDASDDYPANKTGMPALTGDKCIVSLYAEDNTTVDDWAISPALSGHAQIISFGARSANFLYPETIDVLYSIRGTDPADFKPLPAMTDIIVPTSWTRYTVGLPEGAHHFAIRSHAANSFMLALDDFTFDSASESQLEAPVGYKVFRDDRKLTDTDVTDTSFTDAKIADGTHTYHVTAVYDAGESCISNTATVVTSDLDGIPVSECRISAANGYITVSGAMGVEVMICTVDGHVIFHSVTASDSLSVPVVPGIYVVTAAGQSVKISAR